MIRSFPLLVVIYKLQYPCRAVQAEWRVGRKVPPSIGGLLYLSHLPLPCLRFYHNFEPHLLFVASSNKLLGATNLL